ncbi:hepatocyte cell adhesion molecule-like isoform X2 [Carcharodon carcharias]|uniref:hepatocyte cell adhesion molecule-like isoform X2 n=1 Tax=Carcharodon carcharias TaxID=13397 RepID=UPI001B7EED73|nr:hepatocyte cell adhesion molecule-like isoform X2 [Carcharodon carcharias]
MKHRYVISVLPFALLLLLQRFSLLSVGSLGEEDVTIEAFGAIGSSILLDPEWGTDVSGRDVVWEFTGSDGKLVTILDYVPGHHKEEPNENFKSRLQFITSNGSLILNNLKLSDQGVYCITVGGVWKRSTELKLIEPLSEPSVNVTYVDTTIELTCQVSAGKASSILWYKDEKMITNTNRYQFVRNNSTLIISKVMKSDSGSYTCTMANIVSKKNTSYPLVIYGFPVLHYYTMELSTVALIIAAVALTCKIISCRYANTYLELFENLLPIVHYMLLITMFGYWIRVEGPHTTSVLLLGFFCLLLIPPMLSIFMKACDNRRLIKFLKTRSCCLMRMNAVTTSGDFSVLCASVFLIVKRTADKGREAADNLQISLILAVFVPFLIILAIYAICKKSCEQRTRTPSQIPDVKDSDKHEYIDMGMPDKASICSGPLVALEKVTAN